MDCTGTTRVPQQNFPDFHYLDNNPTRCGKGGSFRNSWRPTGVASGFPISLLHCDNALPDYFCTSSETGNLRAYFGLVFAGSPFNNSEGRCCCCFNINSHNQVRGHRTGSSHSGAGEYPREKTQTNQRWYTHILQLTQFMPPPETYRIKREIGSQPTMCQVHTGAYVSLLAPGKTDYTACHPRNTTHVYIARSTYRYAYARQTQVNRKKETKKRKDKKRKVVWHARCWCNYESFSNHRRLIVYSLCSCRGRDSNLFYVLCSAVLGCVRTACRTCTYRYDTT